MSQQQTPAPPAPVPTAAFDYARIRQDLAKKLGSLDTVQVLIQQKLKELAGLISEEGALLLIARGMGIDVSTAATAPTDQPATLPITTLQACHDQPEGTYIHLRGAIVSLSAQRECTRKDGTKGTYRVGTFSDATGTATLMLWGSDASDYDPFVGKPLILENAKLRFYQGRVQIRLTGKSHVHLIPPATTKQTTLKVGP
jgi:hypothetical protein